MVGVADLDDLMDAAREDVFSIYLDVDPTKPEHQVPNPAYRIWLHQAMRQTLAGIGGPRRRGSLRAGRRALAYVDKAPARGRGLAIFAAPQLWREFVLPFPLPNEVQYGRPDVIPLLWAMSEYKAYAILAVYLEHARIAMAYLGRTTVVDDETLELDTSDWTFKSGRTSTYTRRVGVGVGRGIQSDGFDARVDEHRRRFWQGVAQATARALADRHIDRVIIAGPEEAATSVRGLLPEAVRAHVIDVVPLPSYATLAEVQERTLPVALAEHHRRESELVAGLLAGVAANEGAVVGRAATFESLMQGEVKTLVVARDLDGDIWQCTHCESVSATPIVTCPGCGGAAARAPLRQMLPLLARRHGAELEVVGPPMSAQLTGGFGALLRYRVPREVGVS
jgi:peptide chain release factor subunit 1